MTDEPRIKIKHEVVGSITEGRDMKSDWLAQARTFLDTVEKDNSIIMTSGVIGICGHENVALTFPEGLSERHKEILRKEANQNSVLQGASVGDYNTLIKHVVQMGLAFAPQGLDHHRKHECKDGDDCALNEATCVAIPANDMMIDLMATTLGSMPLEAAGHVVRQFLEAAPKLRHQFVMRMRDEDPEAFAKTLQAAGITDEIREALERGEDPTTSGPKFGVITGDAAHTVLRKALDSGAIPEEHRDRLTELLGNLEAASGTTRPDNASETSTFVEGDSTKKHKH